MKRSVTEPCQSNIHVMLCISYTSSNNLCNYSRNLYLILYSHTLLLSLDRIGSAAAAAGGVGGAPIPISGLVHLALAILYHA